MKAATHESPWFCPDCGTLSTGPTCDWCFRDQPCQGPDGPEPGSYWSIVGLPTTSQQGRVYFLLVLLPILIVLLVGVAEIIASALSQ